MSYHKPLPQHLVAPQGAEISSLRDNGFGHRPRAGSKSAGRPDARASANPPHLYNRHAETLQLPAYDDRRDWPRIAEAFCIASAVFALAWFGGLELLVVFQ